MANYRIGELRERIKFMRLSTTQDDIGGDVEAEAPIFANKTPALIRPLGGSEQMQAGRLEATEKYHCVVRVEDCPADLSAKDWIDWDGIRLNIIAKPIRRTGARWQEIRAEAGVAT